jgi:hypothetical protein
MNPGGSAQGGTQNLGIGLVSFSDPEETKQLMFISPFVRDGCL